MSPRLGGKVALVTGAGTGLGRAIAVVYAQHGAGVVVADVAAEAGAATVELIERAGGKAAFVAVDVGDSDQVAAAVAFAEERYGALHALTANAGILGRGHGKSIEEITDDEFGEIMRVNFDGVRLSFKHAIPAIRRAGGGALTATASLAAHRAYPTLPAYSASKGAVIALARSLAAALAPDIRVNVVSPGSVATDITSHARTAGAGDVELAAPTFGGRARPEEVANAHAFLISDEASFVNGQTLIVDGGRSIVPA